MITQVDIARELGLSLMTVYRCLNNKGNVGSRTQELIRRYVREHNYRPNQTARSLKTHHNHFIGILLPSFTYSYYPQIIESIRQNLGEKYHLLLCLSNEDPVMEREQLEVLLSVPVAGILLCPVNSCDSLENCRYLRGQGVPFTLFDRYFEGSDVKCSYVSTESRSASVELVDYLYTLGHRRIAHIGGGLDNSFACQMFEGYCAGLKKHRIKPDARLAFSGALDYETGMAGMRHLLEQGGDFTAVHCANDPIAIGVLEYCRQEGISVPGDISVTGFSDIAISKNVYAPLTTYREPTAEIGRNATELILRQIEGDCEQACEHRLLTGHFVERASCASPKNRNCQRRKL